MVEGLLIEGFPRSASEVVAGEIAEYKGRTYAHLRTMTAAVDGSGDWVRTQKGVAIEVKRFRDVVEGLARLEQSASTNVVVAKIPVGKEQIWIGMQPFKGNLFVFLRRHYRKGAEWYPTPKGVTVRADQLEELLDLAQRVQVAIDAL